MKEWIAALLLGLAVLGLDVWVLGRVPLEIERAGWPTARAEVVESQLDIVVSGSGRSRSRKYVHDFLYRFDLDGRMITGSETHLVLFPRVFAERHRVGSRVEVAYDPEMPARQVIASDRGVFSVRIWLALAILGAVHLLLWEVVDGARSASRYQQSGGVPVLVDRRRQQIRLRVHAGSAWLWLLMGGMLTSIAVMVPRQPGSDTMTAPGWLFVPPLVALVGWAWRRQALASGRLDMVVDERGGWLILPKGSRGSRYRLSALRAVHIERVGYGKNRRDWLRLVGEGFDERNFVIGKSRGEGLAQWMQRQPWFGAAEQVEGDEGPRSRGHRRQGRDVEDGPAPGRPAQGRRPRQEPPEMIDIVDEPPPSLRRRGPAAPWER